MLKKIFNKQRMRRLAKSRRLVLAFAIAIVFFLGGVFALAQIWGLAVFLFAIAFALFTLLSTDSLVGILLRQSESRRQDREFAKAISKTPDSVARAMGRLSPTGIHRGPGVGRKPVASVDDGSYRTPHQSFERDAVHEWTKSNNLDTFPPISTVAAHHILIDYNRNSPKLILHIGSANSAQWLVNVTSLGSNSIPVVSVLMETKNEVGAFVGCPSIENNSGVGYAGSLEVHRPAGSSIGDVTAHMVDTVYIDLGGVSSAETIRRGLPSQFTKWMRDDARIVVVNSRDFNIRKSLQDFLVSFPEFMMENINSTADMACLVKVVP